MKKTPFLAASIALSGFAFLDADAQSSYQQTTVPQQEEKKEKVTQDQLPEPVKSALKSDTYKNWSVGDINKVVRAEGTSVYEVTMTNAQGHTGVVLMNEKGGDASKD
ncbi:hypothetical protein ACFS7Z_14845 [Pontibacter toksunensis]|uniref:PepSY domain-containing protein n=1 Tax=Pontibacter toksunensis TaxID=1332631 RepID=A0ABW6BXC7_9BACT